LLSNWKGSDSPSAKRLPRGRHGLDRAFGVRNQRDRILDAMAEEVALKGYPEVTVSGVTSRAGVSSKTFYEVFQGKVDCFLGAYDAAIGVLMEKVGAVYEAMPEPTPERARAVLAAVLGVFAAEPAFARLTMVEVAAAGPEAVRRYVGVVKSFVPLVDQIEQYEATRRHRGAVNPDPVLREAQVGGVVWTIYQRVVAGETEQLPELLPQLTYLLLAPLLGEQEAAAFSFSEGADVLVAATAEGGKEVARQDPQTAADRERVGAVENRD
jgi:AcrR family transcriptional regulator